MTQEPEHYTAKPLPPRHDASVDGPPGDPSPGFPPGGQHPGLFEPGGFQPQPGNPPWLQGPPEPAPKFRPTLPNGLGKRSVLLGYVLWFFLGSLGAHKFYLSQPIQGVTYVLLTIIGWATTPILIGWLILFIWAVLMVLDVILVPIRVAQLNARKARED